MMQLRVLKRYNDLELGRHLEIGEILEFSDERGTQLINHPSRIVELVTISGFIEKPKEKKKFDTNPPLKDKRTKVKKIKK